MSSSLCQDRYQNWISFRAVRLGLLLGVGLIAAGGSAQQLPNERPLFVQPAQLQVGVYLMLSDSQLSLPSTSGEGVIALTMAPNVSALSVQGLPAGVTADFAGSQLKMTTSGAAAGEYALRVIAEWGKQTRQSELLLRIQEPVATTQWANIETAPVLVPSPALPAPDSLVPASPASPALVQETPSAAASTASMSAAPVDSSANASNDPRNNEPFNTSVSAVPDKASTEITSTNMTSGSTAGSTVGSAATTTFKINPLTLWGGMGATTSGSSLRIGVSHSLGLVSLRGSADLGSSRTGLGADVLLNTPSSFYVGAGLSVLDKNAALGGLIGFRSGLGSRLGYYLEGRGNWLGGGLFSAKSWSPTLNVGVTFRF